MKKDDVDEIDLDEFDFEDDGIFEPQVVKKRDENGELKEYLFIPNLESDEINDELERLSELNGLPVCDPSYVEAEMKRTGKSAEDIIAEYLAKIETIENSQFDTDEDDD